MQKSSSRWQHRGMNAHAEWFESVVGGDSANKAAEKSGVSYSTLTRHLKAGKLDANDVLAIASAYDVNPFRALVDVGLVPSTQLNSAAALSDEELLLELALRMREGRPYAQNPAEEVFNAARSGTLSSLPPNPIDDGSTFPDHLIDINSRHPGPPDTSDLEDWDPTVDDLAVADSSPRDPDGIDEHP